MITRFQATNYACLKDVSLTLTPLHALVGPNDSGKTTLLNAILEAVLIVMGQTTTRASEFPSEFLGKSPHGIQQLLCEIPGGYSVHLVRGAGEALPGVRASQETQCGCLAADPRRHAASGLLAVQGVPRRIPALPGWRLFAIHPR